MGILALASCALLGAQTTYFQFGVDQDALAGAPDFSFLNRPLAASDALFVKNGQFFRAGGDGVPNTEDDERIRLWGVNLAFGANFPTEAESVRIAKRLRRLGVNLVRLHHMDSQPDGNPANAGSLLTTGPYPTLNPVAVARLRTFLDALKAEGIYANLNLKVGYVFRPMVDGVPALPGGAAIGDQSKPFHMIWPRMIELQAKYAGDVIDALQLGGDPVLGLVEINNESSLIYHWQANQIEGRVTGEYEGELRRQWNRFLSRKYETTAQLAAAWRSEETPGGELLAAEGRWVRELHGAASATIESVRVEDQPALRINVTNGSDTVIIKQVGFAMNTARPYTASVEMRADIAAGQTRGVYFDIKEDVSPWRTINAQTVQVGSEWRRYTLVFTPGFATNNGRFAVQVEQFAGTSVFLRNWTLSQPARQGLTETETLEAQNVSLVGSSSNPTEARQNDYLLLLAELDRQYLETILATVRSRTQAPVAGTQMEFGGLLNLDSHANLDYQDRHYYVDHYGFPNVAWDGRDWYITEQSHLRDGLGAFQSAAATREAGRPYTVSEFNQPWPNTYAAEADPTLAAFAAFQDWDGLMHFAYSHGRNWDAGVPNGFNINGDWTKWINFGQSGWLFRSGALAAGDAPVTIPLSLGQRVAAGRRRINGNVAAFLRTDLQVNPAIAFTRRIAVERREEATPPPEAMTAVTPPYRSSTNELTYDPGARRYLIHSAQAAGVLGFLGTAKVTAGVLDVELAPSPRGYAAVLLTPLDQQPVADSKRLLLTNPGFTLRSQPGENREQRLVNYPGSSTRFTVERDQASRPSGDLNGGSRPTWMERVEATVTLRLNASAVRVYPLGSRGERLEELAVERLAEGFRFRLNANGSPAAPWYEIVAE